MTDADDESETETETEAEPESGEDGGLWARTTAPQSEFTTRQVGTGVVVLAVGLAVTFGVPLLLV